MKQVITIALLATTLSVMAKSNTTTIEVYTGPSINDLKLSAAAIDKAIEAKQAEEESSYLSQISKAKQYLKHKAKKEIFQAQFIIKTEQGQELNYLTDDQNAKYYYSLDQTCFTGNIDTANLLLSTAVSEELLNFDETWYDNNKIETPQTISIVNNDGPGETKETNIISKCK